MPLQHLLALVIQLNSQCGSPAFLDKGRNGDDGHWSRESLPSFSLPARPQHCCLGPDSSALQLSGSQQPFLSNVSSASRKDGTCQLAGPSAAAWHAHERKRLSPWSVPPQHPSRSRHLQPQREDTYSGGGSQCSLKHLNPWGI